MRIRHLVAVMALTLPSVAAAEAGMPHVLCRTGSCPCEGLTCGCGQVCTGSGCEATSTMYCANDSECEASCGEFVCFEFQCRSGRHGPDGGLVPGDGGEAGPMHPPRSNSSSSNPPQSCGCGVTPAAMAGAALLAGIALRRGRP